MRVKMFIFSGLLIISTNLLFGQVDSNKINDNKGETKKVNYRVEKNIYIDVVENIDKEHEELVHPVTLSEEAIGRILYAFRIDGPGVSPFNVFSIEEIRKLVDDGRLVKAFLKSNKYEKIKLSRIKDYVDENKKIVESREDTFYLFFKTDDQLYITYVPKGYDLSRFMVKGLDMTDGVRWDGSPFQATISINKKLWTSNLKKSIFPITGDLSKISNVKTMASEGNNKDNVENPTQDNVKEFSLEDLQNELEKLKKMLDAKLISEEEYKKLKEKVLAKAGL